MDYALEANNCSDETEKEEGEEEEDEEGNEHDADPCAYFHLSHKPHHLPGYLLWIITFGIGIVVLFVDLFMVLCRSTLAHAFEYLYEFFATTTFQLVFLVLAAASFSGLLVGVAAALVVFIYPQAAGSGIPELKGYLNGNSVPGLFESHSNWVRMVSAVLVTSAAVAVGREGPLIVLG